MQVYYRDLFNSAMTTPPAGANTLAALFEADGLSERELAVAVNAYARAYCSPAEEPGYSATAFDEAMGALFGVSGRALRNQRRALFDDNTGPWLAELPLGRWAEAGVLGRIGVTVLMGMAGVAGFDARDVYVEDEAAAKVGLLAVAMAVSSQPTGARFGLLALEAGLQFDDGDGGVYSVEVRCGAELRAELDAAREAFDVMLALVLGEDATSTAEAAEAIVEQGEDDDQDGDEAAAVEVARADAADDAALASGGGRGIGTSRADGEGERGAEAPTGAAEAIGGASLGHTPQVVASSPPLSFAAHCARLFSPSAIADLMASGWRVRMPGANGEPGPRIERYELDGETVTRWRLERTGPVALVERDARPVERVFLVDGMDDHALTAELDAQRALFKADGLSAIILLGEQGAAEFYAYHPGAEDATFGAVSDDDAGWLLSLHDGPGKPPRSGACSGPGELFNAFKTMRAAKATGLDCFVMVTPKGDTSPATPTNPDAANEAAPNAEANIMAKKATTPTPDAATPAPISPNNPFNPPNADGFRSGPAPIPEGKKSGLGEPLKLTNPTTPEKAAEEADKRKIEALRAEHRAIVEKGRAILKEGLIDFKGDVETVSFGPMPQGILEGDMGHTGKITVTLRPAFKTVSPRTISRYLTVYRDFDGSVEAFVDRIADDLAAVVRYDRVKVDFVLVVDNVPTKATAKRGYGTGED